MSSNNLHTLLLTRTSNGTDEFGLNCRWKKTPSFSQCRMGGTVRYDQALFRRAQTIRKISFSRLPDSDNTH